MWSPDSASLLFGDWVGEIHGVLVHPKTNPKLPNLLEVARVRGEDTVCTSQLS